MVSWSRAEDSEEMRHVIDSSGQASCLGNCVSLSELCWTSISCVHRPIKELPRPGPRHLRRACGVARRAWSGGGWGRQVGDCGQGGPVPVFRESLGRPPQNKLESVVYVKLRHNFVSWISFVFFEDWAISWPGSLCISWSTIYMYHTHSVYLCTQYVFAYTKSVFVHTMCICKHTMCICWKQFVHTLCVACISWLTGTNKLSPPGTGSPTSPRPQTTSSLWNRKHHHHQIQLAKIWYRDCEN